METEMGSSAREGEAPRPRVGLFCSDLDGTLLGNPEATRRFGQAWRTLTGRPVLVYATGRLRADALRRLSQSALPAPDFLIGGVGTEIYECRRGRILEQYQGSFGAEWDPGRVESILHAVPGLTRQPAEFQGPFKSSWFLRQASPAQLEMIRHRLSAPGLAVDVVYSSSRDLDVLPKGISKGAALAWLLSHLEIDPRAVVVAGDSGNDASMFHLEGAQGIVVENAQPELYELVVQRPVYFAARVLADGVLEGLHHYGVISEVPTIASVQTLPRDLEPGLMQVLELNKLEGLTDEQRDFIQTAYQEAVLVLRRNITPLGFSACSMADNEVVGTDVNYRSVWARDGAITLLYSMDLDDPDLRAAQEQTLRTLFDNLGPSGQVPANVRIDDGRPDYSGVGGVTAIDAGLWAVIAFYNFVRFRSHSELLPQYSTALDRVMAWLLAHDSNANGLLEIPEAGDWTDLFGRSYNVLYDEVLWFRTSVCYARLLERQGRFEEAATWLRRSQQTRNQILERFWPSTSATSPLHSFDEQQFAVGDARYLLSEITPFGFNWRCDVIGNVLAFLFGVLDIDRARTAFRFMWGVGVNEPLPVANLYPAVQAGDPDWKPYYLVNLQNLPHHYHNGGIWPFIGGMWVRFIHRLGLHQVACKELFRLAEANHAGKSRPWEFNEWLHGRTGRPMGKAFQAWSAASYVRACHELEMNPSSDRME